MGADNPALIACRSGGGGGEREQDGRLISLCFFFSTFLNEGVLFHLFFFFFYFTAFVLFLFFLKEAR